MIETFLDIILATALVAAVITGGVGAVCRLFSINPAVPECYHSVPSEQQQAEYCCEECVHHKSCQGE